MTDAEATAAVETTPVAGDVEMTSVDAHAPSDAPVTDASDAPLPVENGAPQPEENATTPAAPSAEQPSSNVEASASSEPTPPTEPMVDLTESESPAPAVTEATKADASADVKMEEPEEPTKAKRNEPNVADSTTTEAAPVQENGDTDVAEPPAKRLKVAPKPSDVPLAKTEEAPVDANVAEAAPGPEGAPADSKAPPVPEAVPTDSKTPPAPIAAAVVSAPIMMSRDDMAKLEEDTGLLKFDVITNDGTPEHMIQLTTLKNIFARQLPKMPREYIVRLVFDRNHRSMVILKNSKQVIGGICYRPFEPNHFAEIAFCAINAADQVKGYGTRLMNHLKEYVKASGITHFLTYADNYAIGYFKKQGFAKVVSMPRANWFGYIKDYDGGTLMECTIHHQINYLRITSMVHAQRKKIQDKIKERSHADIVYPGLTKFAEGRTMDLYMVPGVQEAGWTRAVIRNSRVGTRDPGSLKTQLQQLWKAVSSHRSAWPFHEPVDTTIVVDYLDYIKEPVDLTLVQKRIESGHYLSKAAFKEDLDKMCNNCMVYNTPDTNYYKAAKDLQEFVEKRVQVAKIAMTSGRIGAIDIGLIFLRLGSMASPSETMLVHDELGPLYDFGSLYESDQHETVTYRYVYGDAVAVQLMVAQEQWAGGQSGFCVSPAAQALCEYLEKHRTEIPNGTIVELGAGCGLAGLAIAQLQPDATVVFTDHDPGVLKTIEHNCTQQERTQARCVTKRVRWGPHGADEIAALERDLSADAGASLVVGSDLIYAREIVAELFWTVDRLLKGDNHGAFLMCSSASYDEATEREIDAQCKRFGLTRETLEDTSNGSRVQRFTRQRQE